MRVKIVIGSRGKFRYFIDGKEVGEKEYRKMIRRGWVDGAPPPNTLMETSKAWPRESTSVGVHPKQCKAAEKNSIKHGVPTEFNRKNGKAIFRNNAHQRDYCRMMGYGNRDGGYGEVTG